MRTRLLIYLFWTLLISTILSALIFYILYSCRTMGFEERQGMGILYLLMATVENLAMAILTLPILFQIDKNNYSDARTQALYLIASPAFTMLISCFTFFATSIAFLIPAVTFISINVLFYNRLKRIVTDRSK